MVLNTPPIVRTAPFSCRAYEACLLDASATLDALNDVEDLTVVWDIDVNVDSNEDGIPDNDADLIGKSVTYTFRSDGVQSVKVMAWDEDPERPGTKVVSFAVLPADRTALENLGASLVGEEAKPIAQLGLLAALLLVVVFITRRKSRPEENSVWDEVTGTLALSAFDERDEKIEEKRPEGPPPDYLFEQSLQQAPNQSTALPQRGPPLPESGLPEGWTMEQWEHYGHQWLDSQG
jgi:hypothetical protein